MLSKLLKHDFIDIGKIMLQEMIAILGLSLLVRLFHILGNYLTVFQAMSGMASFVLVVVIIVAIIYTFFIGIAHFYKKVFKDEGYLANTLPVSKNSLLFSKIIVPTIYMIVIVVVSLLALVIAFYQKGSIQALWDGLLLFLSPIGYTANQVSTLLIFTIVLIFVQYLTTMFGVFCAIAVGFSHPTKKVESTFICAVVIYGIFQVISIICLFIALATDTNLLSAMNTDAMIPYHAFIKLFSIIGIGNVITLPFLYIVTKNYLEKKLNLE